MLCNNVGVVLEAGTPLHETSDDAWDNTLAVNLTSYFQFAKAVRQACLVPQLQFISHLRMPLIIHCFHERHYHLNL